MQSALSGCRMQNIIDHQLELIDNVMIQINACVIW